MRSWHLGSAGEIQGDIRVPGDKSISHRALILAALAEGRSQVAGLLRGEDCLATLQALRALGVSIRDSDACVTVEGQGFTGLAEPAGVLDAGNSGTTLRLLAGLLAGRPGFSVLTGDLSLRRRPMRRVTEPLGAMGATVLGRGGAAYPPLAIQGASLCGIEWQSPVASAQVKSALLLAGLQAEGPTRVIEPGLSRDHTERMLSAFGVTVERRGLSVGVHGPVRLRPTAIDVPGDLSSAAFFLAAAAMRPGADVVVRDVGVNPTRTGVLDVLGRMGAQLSLSGCREVAGEPRADVRVRGGPLRGVVVEALEIPRLIDEVPVLATVAAVAEGVTEIRGAGELRVKEVDRLAALQEELSRLGACVSVAGDTLQVIGGRLRGAEVQSGGDHRMAMSLAVAGLSAEGETWVHDVGCVETSCPGFARLLLALAPDCRIHEVVDDGAAATGGAR